MSISNEGEYEHVQKHYCNVMNSQLNYVQYYIVLNMERICHLLDMQGLAHKIKIYPHN